MSLSQDKVTVLAFTEVIQDNGWVIISQDKKSVLAVTEAICSGLCCQAVTVSPVVGEKDTQKFLNWT